MLREIISITGKPGLFRIISHSQNRLIVEDLQSKKRFPVSGRDKIVSLGDIAMYTEGDDKPLGEILDLLYAAQEGKPVAVKELDNAGLAALFESVLPDYDKDRVYPSDIRKLFSWYNQLIAAGITEFKDEEIKEDQAAEAAEAADNAQA